MRRTSWFERFLMEWLGAAYGAMVGLQCSERQLEAARQQQIARYESWRDVMRAKP